MDTEFDANAHLTPEQKEIVRRALSGQWEQGANGYDLTMFRANLQRTPTERIEWMRKALKQILEVRNAGRVARLSPHNRLPR